MACEYCHMPMDLHHPRCPNYKNNKSRYYCSACGEGIYSGEEYIVNGDGDYRHMDCFRDKKDIVKWLGYDVEVMEDDE